jgi:hypothetical protein
MNDSQPDASPSDESLRVQLRIEWQDHIQTRIQTWKSLEIEALLVIGLVGADIKFDDLAVLLVLGLIIVLASLSGIQITKHHRVGQIRKFTHIDRLEETLGLHRTGLLDNVHPPSKFMWVDVVNPVKVNTPLFILRMHLAILIFTIVYVVARIVGQ